MKVGEMSVVDTGAQAAGTLWRREIGAMLALSWPMILTNFAQTAMTATDVMILGHVSATTLAAGALGAVLAFHFGLLGAGVWIGLSAGLAVVAVLLFLRWLRRDRLGLLGLQPGAETKSVVASIRADPPGRSNHEPELAWRSCSDKNTSAPMSWGS